MDIEGKRILVVGLAVSGLPTVRVLGSLGAHVMVNDRKPEHQMQDEIVQLKDMQVEYVFGGHPVEIAGRADFAVVSPGVRMDIPLLQEMRKRGKEVISEVELAYRLTRARIVAVTGTNGKTTTTTLVGEICKKAGLNVHVVGNIGKPIISVALTADAKDIMVAEISSFQLEGIRCFNPVSAAILNITPDHLDRHGTLTDYIEAKARIFENQDEGDFIILNADDENTARLARRCKAKIAYFSRTKVMDAGVFIEDHYIIIKNSSRRDRVCRVDSLKMPGDHNIENAMAAAGLAWTIGIPARTIGDAIVAFEGVEHRLEYVDTIDGVRYINDSKGTNPDASIKAIRAIEAPIVLIAGGYDKGGDFDEFVDSFGEKVKGVVLLGQTADRIKKSCQNRKHNNIYIEEDMENAVNTASKVAGVGDTVLLSPACASWDMYKNFEERGRVFKKAVSRLRRILDGEG